MIKEINILEQINRVIINQQSNRSAMIFEIFQERLFLLFWIDDFFLLASGEVNIICFQFSSNAGQFHFNAYFVTKLIESNSQVTILLNHGISLILQSQFLNFNIFLLYFSGFFELELYLSFQLI